MPNIKLTRLIPRETVGSTKFDFEEAESIVGETLDYYLGRINIEPKVGEPFFLNNFKTEVVIEVMPNNIFRTKNNFYKYIKLKTGNSKKIVGENADID